MNVLKCASCEIKIRKKLIKLIKITNCVCVCGRICNGCDVAVVRAYNSNIQDYTTIKTVYKYTNM